VRAHFASGRRNGAGTRTRQRKLTRRALLALDILTRRRAAAAGCQGRWGMGEAVGGLAATELRPQGANTCEGQ